MAEPAAPARSTAHPSSRPAGRRMRKDRMERQAKAASLRLSFHCVAGSSRASFHCPPRRLSAKKRAAERLRHRRGRDAAGRIGGAPADDQASSPQSAINGTSSACLAASCRGEAVGGGSKCGRPVSAQTSLSFRRSIGFCDVDHKGINRGTDRLRSSARSVACRSIDAGRRSPLGRAGSPRSAAERTSLLGWPWEPQIVVASQGRP